MKKQGGSNSEAFSGADEKPKTSIFDALCGIKKK